MYTDVRKDRGLNMEKVMYKLMSKNVLLKSYKLYVQKVIHSRIYEQNVHVYIYIYVYIYLLLFLIQ